MDSKRFNVDVAQSTLTWTGRKVTGKHFGTIAISAGTVEVSDGRLIGGGFDIDTTSIAVKDVTDPAVNAQFAGHLHADDFFGTARFPMAVFRITNAAPAEGSSYHIDGLLTIKDITHALSFEALVHAEGEALTASGRIIVDRTKYGMRFRSGSFFKDLGDTLIRNEFTLDVDLVASSN